ncbi:MAG: hypothetical protein WBG50_16900 [Desulfomonilaceae bacterium]
MEAGIKVFVIFPLFGTLMGLAWFYQPQEEQPISVLLRTHANAVSRNEKAKIFLKASFNGRAVGHGEVRMDIFPASPETLRPCVEHDQCVGGYTDAQGVFIPNWVPRTDGEYIVTATVTKPGYGAGKSVCFLRVEERSLAERPGPPPD